MTIDAFRDIIWDHYRRAGRASLPWRHTRDPYAILVSEVMLQQTQVSRVTEYYKRFLKRFPSFRALARARTGDVLKVWQGLGYNRRAMFLHRAAQIVVRDFGGKLPNNRGALESLPGIGHGTSGSLMAFAFNKPEVFIETNIRRVFIHFFFKNKPRVTDDELVRYIESSVERKNARQWYWALMDYGTAMAKMPAVGTVARDKKATRTVNPNRRSAHYKKQALFAGSDRQLRGKILRSTLSTSKTKIHATELFKLLSVPQKRFKKVVGGLEREGFIVRKGNYICIK